MVRDGSLVSQCSLCDAGIGGGGQGPGSGAGARGLPGASVVAVGAVLLLLLSLVSGCSLMPLFGCTQGCLVPCVSLCLRRSHARWVFLVGAGCLGPCSCAFLLVLLVRARGLALRLGVCLLVFPAVVCAVTSIPPIFVTKRRSSWACIGNPKPEQETIKGTHAQETSAYQRRPTTQHAAQASNPPTHIAYCVVGLRW